MPEEIKVRHESFLHRLVSSGDQLSGISAGALGVIGITSLGFMLPLTMRIRLDLTDATEFGASALLNENKAVRGSEFSGKESNNN